jgi:glycosyltransferase involved in cell wall biosynthesis
VIEVGGGDGAVLVPKSRFSRSLTVAISHGLEHRAWAAVRDFEQFSVRYRRFMQHIELPRVKRSIARADLLICRSRADLEYILDLGWRDSSSSHFIPNGVHTIFFAERPPDASRWRRILFVGSWQKRKGVDLLPQIVQPALLKHPDVTLTLAGIQSQREEVIGAFEPSIRNRIEVISSTPHFEMPNLYGRHGVFVFPSRFEATPGVVLEAMACGMAVVASNVGGTVDVIHDGHDGLLRSPASPRSFAEALAALLADPVRAAELGRNAKATARRFEWLAIAKAHDAAYKERLA